MTARPKRRHPVDDMRNDLLAIERLEADPARLLRRIKQLEHRLQEHIEHHPKRSINERGWEFWYG